MGGTCSSEDTKCACPIGMFHTAKCTSSCWKPQKEDDPAERRIKAAIRVETALLQQEILERVIAGLSHQKQQVTPKRRASV